MIKRFILVIGALLFFISNSHAAMSPQQAVSIYNKLISNARLGSVPELRFSPSMEVNAFYEGQYITVNRGLLSSVKNSNELALVLGHELAHSSRHDSGSTQAREFAADALGAKYIRMSGYNVCSGAKWFLRQSYLIPDHPRSILRYRALGCH